MNSEIKWTDVPRDDVIAVLNRDMTDDGTIARAREYHHALCKVAEAARRLYQVCPHGDFTWRQREAMFQAMDELTRTERAMMVAKGGWKGARS
jgi:hypothetical protein